MDRIRGWLKSQPAYEPLEDEPGVSAEDSTANDSPSQPFSPTIYIVFMLLGIAMLWAWNMFMAAAPYFQRRFKTSDSILSNFQAAELSVAQIANLGSVLVLAKLQANASYPKRITYSLLINTACFTLLALSTKAFTGVSATGYFVFMLVAVFTSSLATGLMQNGTFSFVAAYARPEYMQATMLGQAVAGVLPPLVQMISVLSAAGSNHEGEQSSSSALAYFLAAVGVTALTFIAFVYLLARHRPDTPLVTRSSTADDDDDAADAGRDPADAPPPAPNDAGTPAVSSSTPRRPNTNPAQSPSTRAVPLTYLARVLFYPWTAVFVTFGVTMVFPVFTQEILSTNPSPPPYLQPAAFIPLALLVWNAGDLLGRVLPLAPRLSLASRPRTLLLLALARAAFVPLYMACNVQRRHAQPAAAEAVRAAAAPDAFYLLAVQLPFGLSNGYVGSCAMMGAGGFVRPGERGAAGGFMGLMLVAGLTVGAFASFAVGNV